uniref:Putative secreted protein salivary gland overexpressed n=1 Tax=Rhipicephalus microplus TaxID=6941 RepID=A0A6M2D9P4_RHIMP
MHLLANKWLFGALFITLLFKPCRPLSPFFHCMQHFYFPRQHRASVRSLFRSTMRYHWVHSAPSSAYFKVLPYGLARMIRCRTVCRGRQQIRDGYIKFHFRNGHKQQ